MDEVIAAAEPLEKPAGGSAVGALLGGRWALGLGGALVVLLAVVEGLHWQAISRGEDREKVVQHPVLSTSPSGHTEPTAPDPGDNP